jgi:hypothetical protein
MTAKCTGCCRLRADASRSIALGLLLAGRSNRLTARVGAFVFAATTRTPATRTELLELRKPQRVCNQVNGGAQHLNKLTHSEKWWPFMKAAGIRAE